MTKRSRACEACQALKVKCEPSPQDENVCERCARTSLSCVPAARRWQRDRIAELEEQVKTLQEKLNGMASSPQGSTTYGDSTRATSVFSTEGAGTCADAASSSELGFLDARLDHEAQARCLQIASKTVGQFWPVVPAVDAGSATSRLESVRTETPTKLMAIFGFAMSPADAAMDAQCQNRVRTRVVEILGQAAVGLRSPSFDLIQAALVASLWSRPCLDANHGNPIQLVALAHNLSVEFGLGGPAMQSSAPAWFSRIQGPPTLEMQQTWLLSWAASTMAALGLRRGHDFDWGSSHSEALQALEMSGASPLFLELLYTIRLHAKVASVLELCHVHSFHDINSDLVTTTRDEICDGLNALTSRPLALDPQLRFWRMLVAIHVNEPVLHTATNKILFGAPYVADKIGASDIACPPEVTKTAAVALWSLVEACHLAIDVVVGMEPRLILGLPSLCFGPAVSYALSILVKVYVAISAPSNTYGQVLSCETLRVREAVQKLVAVKESLTRLDPHLGNWNTRIIGSVEWLGTWLDDYEAIIARYRTSLEREAAEQAIGGLSPNGHF
ncbi:hypothetical protein F66182_7000 [Fusarium sp. NRRL 66182]|nr:hypothetical protein F66182_7000 [Fusarium sp. NRRL 66182]